MLTGIRKSSIRRCRTNNGRHAVIIIILTAVSFSDLFLSPDSQGYGDDSTGYVFAIFSNSNIGVFRAGSYYRRSSYSRRRHYRPRKKRESLLYKYKKRRQHNSVKKWIKLETMYNNAVELYKALEWDRAEELFKKTLASRRPSDTDKCVVYIFLGAIAYQRGQVYKARRYFSKAYKKDSSKGPSPKIFSPPMIEFYKAVTRR